MVGWLSTRWLRRLSRVSMLVAILLLAYHFVLNLSVMRTLLDPAWSHPLLMQTVPADTQPVLAVLADGTATLFTPSEQGIDFSAAQQGRVVAPSRLLVQSRGAHDLQAVGGGGEAGLFWQTDNHLWAATFTSQGHVKVPPLRVARGVLAYAARRGGEKTQIVMAIPDTVLVKTLLPGGGTEEPPPLPLPGLVTVDAQVLQNGDLLVGFVTRREKYEVLGVARLHNDSWVEVRGLAQVLLGESGTIERLALAVDFTRIYAAYVVNDGGTGLHPVYMVSSPLVPQGTASDAPQPIPLVGGELATGVVAKGLYDPSVLPGQNGDAQIAFVSRVEDGLDARFSIVTAQFQKGAIQRLSLGYGGRLAYHPAFSANSVGSSLALATLQGSRWSVQLVSRDPTWRSTAVIRRMYDGSAAIAATARDLLGAYIPTLLALSWLLPVYMAIGAVYLLWPLWAGDQAERLFFVGVGLATLLQAIMVPTFLGGGSLAPALPFWLNRWLPAILISLAIALLAMPVALLQGRRRGWLSALGPLTAWFLVDVGLLALLYGPFLHRT